MAKSEVLYCTTCGKEFWVTKYTDCRECRKKDAKMKCENPDCRKETDELYEVEINDNGNCFTAEVCKECYKLIKGE